MEKVRRDREDQRDAPAEGEEELKDLVREEVAALEARTRGSRRAEARLLGGMTTSQELFSRDQGRHRGEEAAFLRGAFLPCT